MYWADPPLIKIYEALGAVADGRVVLASGTIKVFSSSGNKSYDVTWDPASNSIMTNDNASFYNGTLGYPAIAYLLSIRVLWYQPKVGEALQGILWKDINQKLKNDFEKTIEFILAKKPAEEARALKEEVENIAVQIKELKLKQLGKKVQPPKEY